MDRDFLYTLTPSLTSCPYPRGWGLRVFWSGQRPRDSYESKTQLWRWVYRKKELKVWDQDLAQGWLCHPGFYTRAELKPFWEQPAPETMGHCSWGAGRGTFSDNRPSGQDYPHLPISFFQWRCTGPWIHSNLYLKPLVILILGNEPAFRSLSHKPPHSYVIVAVFTLSSSQRFCVFLI